MREVVKQAATIEQAIELALSELNLTREQVTYEVLEYPEKRFFFKKPAKVKVVELEEDFSVKNLFEEKETKAKPKKENNQPKVKKEPEKAEEVKEKEEPKQPAEEKVQEEKEENCPAVEISMDQASAKVKYAVEFIKSIIDEFYKNEYQFKIFKTQSGCIIKIEGEDAGCLIGRKGETMEAISYLTSLAANRFEDSGEKISVDVADYRQKREKDLQQLARKMAVKVAKTGRSYSFEPMNPYERRVIHSTVGEMKDVKSESKGEGSQRRVVIYPLNPKNTRFNKNRRNSNRPERKPQVQKTREEKFVDDTGASLYAKIEL